MYKVGDRVITWSTEWPVFWGLRVEAVIIGAASTGKWYKVRSIRRTLFGRRIVLWLADYQIDSLVVLYAPDGAPII